MELIKFNDACTVERKGRKDKYDNPVVDIIFQGSGLYQEESSLTSQGMIVYRASLFLPEKVAVKVNDLVRVDTPNHGKIEAVVENIDIVSLPITGKTITKVLLNQGLL
jgi:hypothetical protein